MKKPSNLLDQEDAVGSYLADMLSDPAAETSVSQPLLDSTPLDNLVLLRQALEQVPAGDEPEEPAAETAGIEAEADTRTAAPAEAEAEAEDSAPSTPDFPLQCLMFSVGKQQLSMPLIEMSGVVEVPETLSRLPGSASAVIGVFQYRGQNVQIIDSAALLGIKRDLEQPPAKLIVLQGDKWAITADSLASVVVVEESDVKLGKKTQHSMSLGTIKSSLAQLLSPQTIVRNLDGGQVFDSSA